MRLLLEGYFETIICTILNLRKFRPTTGNFSVDYSNYYSLLTTILLVVLPIWTIIFYWRNRKKWTDEEFEEKWGAILD